jgi:hypothetical protein
VIIGFFVLLDDDFFQKLCIEQTTVVEGSDRWLFAITQILGANSNIRLCPYLRPVAAVQKTGHFLKVRPLRAQS